MKEATDRTVCQDVLCGVVGATESLFEASKGYVQSSSQFLSREVQGEWYEHIEG